MSDEPWTREERDLLEAVPAALRGGVELLEWWRATDAARSYAETYEESFVFNRPEDTSFGFFDRAPLSSGPLAVNGNVQRMFYDEPKSPPARGGRAAEWMDEQVREFVLHYFLRISDFRRPQPVAEDRRPLPGLDFLSQCPDDAPERVGFGFSQLYHRRAGGAVGSFGAGDRERIVDLRRLGDDYEWIVLRNPIFDFKFRLKPFGDGGPQLVLPLSGCNYLVLSPDFVIDERRPEDGVLGRYGLGYAFVRDPRPGVLAYGPGELEPAFELLVWEVRTSGEVTVRATFVANEPTAMLNLALDPFAWGFELAEALGPEAVNDLLAPFRRFYRRLPWSRLRFDPVFPAIDLLNAATLGQAGERLCISRRQLKKDFLFLHFRQHRQTLLGSLQTWRQIPDWLDAESLPDFVRTGRSA